jgi:heme-degrading monooxygenase HmoA
LTCRLVSGAIRIELSAGGAASAGRGGTLYRALRDDVPFPFVAVGGDAGAPYELVHEDGAADGPGGVVLIDPFAAPPEDDAGFLAAWHAAREQLAAHRGYQGSRLYRAAGPAAFRFLALSRWSSPLAFARAAGGASAAHPAMYLPVAG